MKANESISIKSKDELEILRDAGKILAEIALPVFGVVSDLPLQSLAQHLAEVNTAAQDLGIPFPDPVLSLITLTGAAIPYLRICEEGLVNLKDGRQVDLIVESNHP